MEPKSRLEAVKAIADQKPNDLMAHYALASEYLKVDRLEEAIAEMRKVIGINPDYTAAYQQLGSTLGAVGRNEEAREVFLAGLEVAKKNSAMGAKNHIEALLKMLDEGQPLPKAGLH